MKKYWNKLALAAAAAIMAACAPTYPEPTASGLPQASNLDVTIQVDQETNYVTFTMNNKGVVPIWIFGEQKIDGKASKKYSYTQNGVSLRFREAGEYAVEVKAYNANGISQGSVVKTFTLDNTYRDPFDPTPYINAVSNGGSQNWVWNSTVDGHFGCGETVDNPKGWWSCEAGGKEGFLYDDIMTFASNGEYTYDPVDGFGYANKGSEYKAEYKTGDADYLFGTETKTTKYTFESSWNDAGIEEVYLVLGSGSEMSYVPHKSIVEEPRYLVVNSKASEMKKKLQMVGYVKTPDNPDGIAWYYEFVPEGSAGGGGDEEEEDDDPTFYDINGAGNLWKSATINPLFWFADGSWTQIADPEYELLEGNGIQVIIPDGIGGAEWQGQTQLQTNVPASKDKQYDFCLTLKSSEDATYTVKLAWKGNDNDHAFFYVSDFVVKADEPKMFKMPLISPDVDYDAITLFVDMGRTPAGATVEVTDICFQEHEEIFIDTDGDANLWKSATINPLFWFADGSWTQIADPEYELLEGNGIQVVIPDGIGGAEWQGQTQLQTNVPASASQRYDFALTLTSSVDAIYTVKLAWKGNDNDHSFFYVNNFEVKAEEPKMFTMPAISPDVDYDAITLFVDMGRTPAGATVTVSNITFQEHATISYDVKGDANLWKGATINPLFWFADGSWTQIADPEYELLEGNGIQVIIPDGIGGAEWQGQTQLQTNVPASASKRYDFCLTLTSSAEAVYTVKLAWKGNDNDHSFFYVSDFKVKAEEPKTFRMPAISPDVDYDAITLFVDMGRTPAGASVEVTDICFQEHK